MNLLQNFHLAVIEYRGRRAVPLHRGVETGRTGVHVPPTRGGTLHAFVLPAWIDQMELLAL